MGQDQIHLERSTICGQHLLHTSPVQRLTVRADENILACKGIFSGWSALPRPIAFTRKFRWYDRANVYGGESLFSVEAARQSLKSQGLREVEAFDVAVQPDDRIVVAGTTLVGTRYLMAIARLEADGVPDAGFGSGGLTAVDPYAVLEGNTDDALASGDTHRAYKALIAPDGKVYAAGLATLTDPRRKTHFAVLRLNADGTPDAGFGGDASATAVLTDGPDIAYALGLQSDGKVVLAGAANNALQIGLARFHDDGRLDMSVLDRDHPDFGYFGYGPAGMGVALVETSTGGELGKDMVMLEDNSIAVAALALASNPALGFNTDRMALVHVDPGGRLISSATAPVSPDYDYPGALVRQADGKLLLVGRAGIGAAADFAILRFNPDLTPDTAFGESGVMRVDFFGSTDSAEDAAIQPDGGIVVVGAARNGFISGVGMVRLTP